MLVAASWKTNKQTNKQANKEIALMCHPLVWVAVVMCFCFGGVREREMRSQELIGEGSTRVDFTRGFGAPEFPKTRIKWSSAAKSHSLTNLARVYRPVLVGELYFIRYTIQHGGLQQRALHNQIKKNTVEESRTFEKESQSKGIIVFIEMRASENRRIWWNLALNLAERKYKAK